MILTVSVIIVGDVQADNPHSLTEIQKREYEIQTLL